MESLIYWLWLSSLRGLSVRAQLRLLNAAGSPEALWQTADPVKAFSAVEGIRLKDLQALSNKSLDSAQKILSDCRAEGISILTMADDAYPRCLREIETAPPVLYYRGTLMNFDSCQVTAVVGSRNASEAGLRAAARMGWELAACGSTVISGAAKGIDSYALQGALEAGGRVAAVLGNGLDIVYPAQARELYHAIAENGCLISEFAPGTKPFAQNFPRRNRIMSGLSDALLVVEAAKKSGTLITVDYALEQGRDVYAMPGSPGLDSCEGSNALLRDGAGFALSGWDVLQNYMYQYPGQLSQNETAMSPESLKAVVAREEAAARAPRKTAGKSAEKAPRTGEKNTKSGEKTASAEKNPIDNGKNTNYIDLQQLKSKLNPEESAIVDAISLDTRHVDDIISATGLAPAKVLALLTMLEVRGIVAQRPGKLFSLKS